MGALNGANSQSGWGANAPRPASELFASNFKPRSASTIVHVLIVSLLGATGCAILSLAAEHYDFSEMPLVRDLLNPENASVLRSLGIWMLLTCVWLAMVEAWLRHYMPMRHEVANDFIRGMQSCGVIPPDLKTDEIAWSVRLYRFRRKAHIRFWLRYPNRSYEDMLPMVSGVVTAFRRARRVTPDRASRPYTMALVVDYGDNDD